MKIHSVSSLRINGNEFHFLLDYKYFLLPLLLSSVSLPVSVPSLIWKRCSLINMVLQKLLLITSEKPF